MPHFCCISATGIACTIFTKKKDFGCKDQDKNHTKVSVLFVGTCFGIVFPLNLGNELAEPDVARNNKMRLWPNIPSS